MSGVPTLWRKAEGNTAWRVMARCMPALRGLRPLARMETTCTGTGRSTGWPLARPSRSGPHREGRTRNPMMHGPGEVGPAHSTGEVAEQRRASGRGGDGGKGRGQGQCGRSSTRRTQSWESVSPALDRVREAARRDKTSPVHGAAAPRDRRPAALVVPSVEEARGARRRRGDVGAVRRRA